MTCAEVESQLVAAGDGHLDLPAAMRLSAHLEECAACRARAGLWRRLVPGMRALVLESPDAMRGRRMQIEVERQLALARAPQPAMGWRRVRWSLGLGLAASAAFVALLWLRSARAPGPPAPFATVVRVEGVLSVGARPLAASAALAANSELALAGDGRAELALARGARVRLTGPARVRLRGGARDVALRLEAGTVDAEVAHREPGETFVVETRDLRVEVRGTRFAVGVAPEDGALAAAPGGSWVRVDEGRVEVKLPSGESHFVGAGETFASSPPAVPAAGPPSASASASAWPIPDSTPVPSPRAPATCADATRACEAAAHETRDRMRTGDQGGALRVLAAAPRAARPLHGDAAGCGPAIAACQDELGYLRAESLRSLGRIDDAIRAYHRLDRAGKPSAMRQNARYAAAELELRGGHPSRARADYQRALAASPRGALREEALLGVMNSAAASGDSSGARSLARRYLDEFPRGIGAARAETLVGGER